VSLSELYNTKVVHAEKWKRPLDISVIGQILNAIVSHSGVVVTLSNGAKY
jgi:hypothetical protein